MANAAYLKFLVDALVAVDVGVERANLLAFELKLLFELLNFADMCITLRNILRFKLVLLNEYA